MQSLWQQVYWGNTVMAYVIAAGSILIAWLINFMIQLLITSHMRRRGETEERIKHLSGMLIVVKGLVWVIGLLTLARNFGFDVSTLLASLGVGGIAIALASQAILGDLFSYLVISNTNMTNSTIRNWKRMEQRRVAFKLGVVYRTSYKQLQQIPSLVKAIVLKQQNVRFDRAHLLEYGNYSINFEIVYFITDPDYNLFMDTHQAVLFPIHEEFSKLGIEFALPAQTLFIGGFQEEQTAKNRELNFRGPTEKTPANR